ncbi:hypothetical protein QBC44DRAFT_315486 [Cladorrhinum sp. PSN332]|nr:hypothetical protein QBC44DRAFT_315486 [Cladorrhinum sp. PSN332]
MVRDSRPAMRTTERTNDRCFVCFWSFRFELFSDFWVYRAQFPFIIFTTYIHTRLLLFLSLYLYEWWIFTSTVLYMYMYMYVHITGIMNRGSW